jgi:PAS domain S-box-containing protein
MRLSDLTGRNNFFVASVLLTTIVFVLEVLLPFHALTTVAYIIVVIFILGSPRQGQHATWLGMIATTFILAGYIYRASEFVDQPSVPLNRALAVFAIWLSVYFNVRVRKIMEGDLRLREQLHAVFNNATEGMVVVNRTGQIVLANAFAENLFAYNSGELIGLPVEDLMPKRFGFTHQEHRLGFMKNPQNRPMGSGMELIAKRKDGSEFPVEISLSHYTNEEGSFAIAFILDLTERKKAIEKLQYEQALTQTYFELAPVIFVVLDNNGNVVAINDYGCRLLGLARKGIVGQNWFARFLHPEIRDELLDYFDKVLQGGQSESFMHYENPILNHRGEEIEISWRNEIIRDIGGGQMGVLSAGTDITEKKKQERMIAAHHGAIQNLNEHLEVKIRNRTTELNEAVHKLEKINQQLENNQRLLNAVVHHFPNGVIGVLNHDLKYIFADGQELHNIGLHEFGNAGERMFDDLHPAVTKTSEEKIKAVFNGTHVSFDVEFDEKAFTVSATPLPNEKGKVNEILVVIRNITDRKKIERELLKSIEKEKELSAMKSKFVTMASHEFRTPLTTILSSVFLMENYSTSDLATHKENHLGKIKRAASQLTELLNDFISLGKLEEGKVKVVNAEINIREFIDDLIPELDLVRKPNQAIRSEYVGDHDRVMLDKQLLRSVVLNLIGNAVKYSPSEAEIKVHAEVNESGLTIKVTDHGIGIPEDDQPHIFRRFHRAQNAANIQGTGLGLNITRRHVRLMKGKIEFISKLNEGSTFTVFIPNA